MADEERAHLAGFARLELKHVPGLNRPSAGLEGPLQHVMLQGLLALDRNYGLQDATKEQ